MNFNLMTLGGIAAAIGLIIDDAIVVVEAIYAKIATGMGRLQAIPAGIAEIFAALLGSTLTPVVVFVPLAFLDGIVGVFFRALALTMVVSLLTSSAAGADADAFSRRLVHPHSRRKKIARPPRGGARRLCLAPGRPPLRIHRAAGVGPSVVHGGHRHSGAHRLGRLIPAFENRLPAGDGRRRIRH